MFAVLYPSDIDMKNPADLFGRILYYRYTPL